MKKLLYTVELPYSINATEEQRKKLDKYTGASFKEEEDFKMSSYDTGYNELTDTEKEAYKKKEYKAYLEKEKKEIKIEERRFPVCIEDFAKDCYFTEFKILKPIEVNVEMKLIDIEATIERFESAVKAIPENTFNSLTNVHIGGSLLMTVNETKLIIDACTDVLQTSLDSGWRIVACCIQPDGRRPDYVLGRYNPEREVFSDCEKG